MRKVNRCVGETNADYQVLVLLPGPARPQTEMVDLDDNEMWGTMR